jgi:hypothetical protein
VDLCGLGGAEDGRRKSRIAGRATRALAFGTSRGPSAGFWRASQDWQSWYEPRQPALDARRRELARWLGTVPGQSLVNHPRPRQTHLGVSQHHEPGPAVGVRGVAHAWEGPIERLLEEAEGVLQIEAPHEGTPRPIQVGDLNIGWAMPPEPERLGVAGPLGQAADLDEQQRAAHQRASAPRIALGVLALCLRMQLRPRPHPHHAVLRIFHGEVPIWRGGHVWGAAQANLCP